MKIASLLTQFLITNKRLDLTGIGTFLITEADPSQAENQKTDKQPGTRGVSFQSNASIRQSAELVEFIAKQTGKIKALAAADLESHLSQARQFLNIGNPFLFDGIGLLEKNNLGEYALKQAAGMTEKAKEYPVHEKTEVQNTEKTAGDFKKILYYDKVKTKWRKPVAGILIIAGLALTVWGGFTVYKRTSGKNNSGSRNKKELNVQGKDSIANQKDSLVPFLQNISPGMQKFVLEVCNAKRASERYGRLKTFLWNVQMETKDSIVYKLFMLIPATASDTSRIIDSLSLLSGKKVYIEK